MAKVYENIAVTLDRADEILAELLKEYDHSLERKKVRPKAKQLTHDVCEKLRSALDRIARRYWDTHVRPHLSEQDRNKADIYFPIAPNQSGLNSTLGRWRWKSVRSGHQLVDDYLLAQQPFTSPNNKWLTVVNDLAVQGKHIDLIPQKRTEIPVTKVERSDGGMVIWGQQDRGGFVGIGPGVGMVIGPGNSVVIGPGGVRFVGNDISAMGAPIDPRTQSTVPTANITERKEIWVNFLIDGYDNLSAAPFCKEACRETRRIVQEMTDKFSLS